MTHQQRRFGIHEHRRRHYEYGTPQQAERTYVREENERAERTNCSVCGKGPMPYYELEPGTGRCQECMT